MKCARCHREVERPVELAGMRLGGRCAQRVREAVLQLQPVQQHVEIDMRQIDFFRIPGLLDDAVMQECTP